ncbi:desmoglein-2.1-like [Centroberyx affinis]|uniref:desmoglein-2.1-like n=1 Tax=Centroberyx affinis TaxID=166261 RepID=UPI003A5C3854
MNRISLPVLVLALFAVVAAVVEANSWDGLVRHRREWLIPPVPLEENVDYTKKTSIARIRSDFDEGDGNVKYSLSGIGADKFPFHLFVVNPDTGLVRVTGILDRETIHRYHLLGVATFRNSSLADKIDLRIRVIDQNDNPPVFGIIEPGAVDELSPPDTFVLKVTASDLDEPWNENSRIAYTIVDQQPPGEHMFRITRDGEIRVKQPTLDRELHDTYILTVKGQDLNGKPEGNTGTGTVTISIRDVNDNLPTLEKDEYAGSIQENTEGVEVMRIRAEDLDMKDTENWEAVFDIVKGNEAGYFSIKTDPKTNEGILMLDKAVDYKDVKDLELGLAVRNKVEPYNPGGTTNYKIYPIKINVVNKPRFDPKVKAIPISEGGQTVNINEVIGSYPALDGDTLKPAKNVRYAKGSDPGNWLTIDPKTAEIKLNEVPDRESPYLVNGTYFAKVLCMTEYIPFKTATGTIAIEVEDFNDHCPTLTSNVQTMCTTVDTVTVSAEDEDAFPNSAPFSFYIVPEGTKGKWVVEHLNDTSAILRAQESMWPGSYEVALEVKDQQGLACPDVQHVKVEVCTCEEGKVCGVRGASSRTGAELGAAAIGLIFLGLLMLLLIPLLLLFCNCGGARGLPGGFTEMPFDTKSHLMAYHTEGQGENTEVPVLNMILQVDGEMVQMGNTHLLMAPGMPGEFQKSFNSMDGTFYRDGYAGGYREGTWAMGQGMSQVQGSGFYSEFENREAGGMYHGIALLDYYLGQYYTQKASCAAENQAVKDSLLVYDYEGQGSSAGSVGCSSQLESDNDLQFLDDLGPKFKTLAEVCRGKEIQPEVKTVISPLPRSLPRPTINTVSSVRSTMSAQQQLPPPQPKATVPQREQTVVKESSNHSHIVTEGLSTVREGMTTARGGMTTVREGMANQGQTLLLQQQPVYYTSTPVLQPMHYIVQPQLQNTMLLAETPATNLQGMIMVNGAQTGPAHGMVTSVLQGQTVMPSAPAQGQGMVFVERSGVGGQGVHVTGGGANLIHTGNLSGSQAMMVVEGQVPVGSRQMLQGSQTCLVQGGTLQRGGISGSQSVLVVEGPTASGGQLVQGAGGLFQMSGLSGSQRFLYSSTGSQNNMVGLNGSSTTMSTVPGHRKVVMQEKRVVTTEKVTE